MIYQGQEQGLAGDGVPSNREAIWLTGFDTNHELYQFTKLMNQIRRHAINTNRDYLDYDSHAIYSDDSTVTFRKGFEGRQIVSVLSSGGEQTGPYDLNLPVAFTPGAKVTDVVSCTNYTVNDYGQLVLPMEGGLPHILFPAARMNGSELCGFTYVSIAVLESGARSLSQAGFMASALALVIGTVMAFYLI